MKKKLLIMLVFTTLGLFSLSSTVSAVSFVLLTQPKKVAIFLEGPSEFTSNEKIRKEVSTKTKEKLEAFNCIFVPFSSCQEALGNHQKDLDIIVNQPKLSRLKKTDLQLVAQDLGADYAICIQVSNSLPRTSPSLYNLTARATVSCKISLLNVSTGQYVGTRPSKKNSANMLPAVEAPSSDDIYYTVLRNTLDGIEFIDGSNKS